MAQRRWSWVPVLAGMGLLQFIAVIHWEEAGWITIVNLIMLLGLIVYALASRFQLAAENDAHQLSKNG